MPALVLLVLFDLVAAALAPFPLPALERVQLQALLGLEPRPAAADAHEDPPQLIVLIASLDLIQRVALVRLALPAHAAAVVLPILLVAHPARLAPPLVALITLDVVDDAQVSDGVHMRAARHQVDAVVAGQVTRHLGAVDAQRLLVPRAVLVDQHDARAEVVGEELQVGSPMQALDLDTRSLAEPLGQLPHPPRVLTVPHRVVGCPGLLRLPLLLRLPRRLRCLVPLVKWREQRRDMLQFAQGAPQVWVVHRDDEGPRHAHVVLLDLHRRSPPVLVHLAVEPVNGLGANSPLRPWDPEDLEDELDVAHRDLVHVALA